MIFLTDSYGLAVRVFGSGGNCLDAPIFSLLIWALSRWGNEFTDLCMSIGNFENEMGVPKQIEKKEEIEAD